MKVLSLKEIRDRANLSAIIEAQELGFKAYSEGKVNVPPVGHIAFDEPPGDYHIKYGAIVGDDVFVVKAAAGFTQNQERYNLPAIQGLMLVFSALNGRPLCLLQDEGYLTELRTAIAGLISAKYLGPKEINAIGILGTGGQARFQIELLKELTDCRKLWVWGRTTEKAMKYKTELETQGFNVTLATSPSEVAQKCNLIVTSTLSNAPLLQASDLRPGMHITAMGADAPGKQEIDPQILAKADVCVVDSRSQCIDHGEVREAVHKGVIGEDKLIELGEVITNPTLGRTNASQITVADLTGVAVQDIQIAKAILGEE